MLNQLNKLFSHFSISLQFIQSASSATGARETGRRRGKRMTRSAMEKSIGIMFLQVIGAAIVCGLSVAGTGSASSIMNNSLNPYSTSGSILSSSTASSMLESYLQTFPINEHQNILTTVYHASAKQHQATTMGNVEKEKLTTSSASSSYSSTTHLATEASSNQNTQTPFISTGSSSLSVPTATGNLSENPEQPILISNEPVLLGCGPNNREGIGIQKALDWLREKRVSDYGWDNDTHFVILAKEVSQLWSNCSRNCKCLCPNWLCRKFSVIQYTSYSLFPKVNLVKVDNKNDHVSYHTCSKLTQFNIIAI